MSKYKTILSCGSIEQLTKMINEYFYSNDYTVEFPNLINSKKDYAFLNQFIIGFKNGRYSLNRIIKNSPTG